MKTYSRLLLGSVLGLGLCLSFPRPAVALDSSDIKQIFEDVLTAKLLPGVNALIKNTFSTAAEGAAGKKTQTDAQQANASVTDAREDLRKKEEEEKKKAEKTQESTKEALEKYKPTLEECAAITTKIAQNYVSQVAQTTTNALVDEEELRMREGVPGGVAAFNKKIADDIALNSQKPEYSESELEARQRCTTPACYNTNLGNRLKWILAQTAAERKPNAPVILRNPLGRAYFMERQAWEEARSDNLKVLQRVKPRLHKSLDFYQQALTAYKAAGMEAKLLKDFPNADKVGLSEIELNEARLNADVLAGGIRGTGGALNPHQVQRVAITRDDLKKQVERDEADKKEYDAALAALRALTPPAVPIAALSTTTSPPPAAKTQ